MKKNSICFVAGGSGGHIIPCLTMAYQHNLEHSDAPYTIITGATALEKDIVKASTTPLRHITLSFQAPPYKQLYLLPFWFIRFFTAFIKSLYLFIRNRPKEVISTGSHIALPACFAAWILRIPVTLYELNVEPGKTTRLLAPCATTINVCFPQTVSYFKEKKCFIKPYPVKFTEKDKHHDKTFLRQKLGITPSKKVVLVLGGSQGSIFLNSIMPHMFSTYPALKDAVHVIHQTGAIDPTDWRHWYYDRGISAHVFAYSNEILLWYTVADLIMCRSGAGTLAEVVFLEKPCITIPLETHSTNHQKANAYAYQELYPKMLNVVLQGEIAHAERSLIALLSLEAYAQQKVLE